MDVTVVPTRLRTASSIATSAPAASREIVASLGDVDAAAVLFFASPALDGTELAGTLIDRFPAATVMGCTTAGEFTEQGTSTGGVSAVALPRSLVRRSCTALATLESGVRSGMPAAIGELERQLGTPLRDLDPDRYVGFVLIDGLHGDEEAVNEELGNVAPLLSFVGGSAGDDLQFSGTRVFCGEARSDHGAALMIIETTTPFRVVKTCSFVPTGRTLTVTDADLAERVVWTLDGRPATEAYAEAVGCRPQDLDSGVFMSHPLGLMIDGKPWIRSPQRVIDGRGIKFYCQILPHMRVEVMRSTDLVADTRTDLRQAYGSLGGQVSGTVAFNCILRRLEIDQNGQHRDFTEAFDGVPTAGFHTYGESWLGHINQTLTAVLFGSPPTVA